MKMYIIHEIISDCLCARKHTSNAAPKAAHSGEIGLIIYDTICYSIIYIGEIICALVCLCARKHTSNAAPKAAHSGVIGQMIYKSIIKI